MVVVHDQYHRADEDNSTKRRSRYRPFVEWQLEELEYLYSRSGSKGKEYAYALNYKGQGNDEERFYLNLTSVEEIKRLIKEDNRK